MPIQSPRGRLRARHRARRRDRRRRGGDAGAGGSPPPAGPAARGARPPRPRGTRPGAPRRGPSCRGVRGPVVRGLRSRLRPRSCGVNSPGCTIYGLTKSHWKDCIKSYKDYLDSGDIPGCKLGALADDIVALRKLGTEHWLKCA